MGPHLLPKSAGLPDFAIGLAIRTNGERIAAARCTLKSISVQKLDTELSSRHSRKSLCLIIRADWSLAWK